MEKEPARQFGKPSPCFGSGVEQGVSQAEAHGAAGPFLKISEAGCYPSMQARLVGLP